MLFSPRNPGFFAAACALLVLTGCGDKKEYDSILQEIAELNEKNRTVKAVRNELKAEELELKRTIHNREKLLRKESEVRLGMNEIEEYHRELKAAVTLISPLTEKWQKATQQSLIGEKLGLIRIEGKTLADAVVVGLNPETVTLKYAGGDGEFDLEKLPVSLRKKLIHAPTILLEAEIAN